MGAEVFVHPGAMNDSDHVGAGTRIWAFAHVMEGAVVGKDCNIGEHCFIEKGAELGLRLLGALPLDPELVPLRGHPGFAAVWERITEPR